MKYKVIFFIFTLFFFSQLLNSQQFVDFEIDTLSPKKACDSLRLKFRDISVGANSYFWDFGDGTTSTLDSVVKSFSPGTYPITHTINGTLPKSDTIFVNQTPIANFSDSIIPQTGVFSRIFVDKSIKDTINNPVYTYKLNYGDGDILNGPSLSKLKRYSGQGTYTVKMIINDQLGCIDSAQIDVSISDPALTNLPNIFTPNDDHINDLFVVNSNGITTMTLEIFNRAGELIYKNQSKIVTWDGRTMSGSEAPTGIYYYILTSEDNHYDVVKNKIYLFRENN